MQAITSAGEGFLLKDRSASRPEFYAARLLVRDGVLVLLFVDLIHGFVCPASNEGDTAAD